MSKLTKKDRRRMIRMAENVKNPGNQKIKQRFMIWATGHEADGTHRFRVGRLQDAAGKPRQDDFLTTSFGAGRPWRPTQRLVALSSCEAEVYAMNKGAAETSGIWRIEFDIVPQTDASAARGVVDSPGAGKTLRHIDTHKLWSPIGIKGQDLVV